MINAIATKAISQAFNKSLRDAVLPFTGNALIVCKATKEHEQLFRAFSIDMNHKDVWLVSENESNFVVLDSFNVINTNGKWIEYNPALH